MERYTLDEVGIDTDLGGWWEIERNDDGQVTMRRLVIQHNNYPTLVGTLEVEVKPHGNGFNEWLSNKRIIQDDGHSSINAVRQVASALDQLRTIIQQEHKGGAPEGTREETAKLHRWRVRCYIGAKRGHKEKYGYHLGMPTFCREWGMSEKTLYRAFNFVEENGPDELREDLARARGQE
jgi:AraC-like DNA-binding protein